MINISTSKQLDIILPNTNKALAHVLKDATVKELEVISKGKDLKSVMNTILKRSANNSSADKELLQLVKNNPTLKNLGDVSKTIKELLSSIKSDTNPLPLENKLKNFLVDIKDLKNSELKQKLENSGVFLESKLKNAQNPLLNLKSELQSLLKELQTSNIPSAKLISKETIKLLNTKLLESASLSDITKYAKDNSKSTLQLASDIQSLIAKLKTSLKGSDVIHTPKLAEVIQKLEHQTQPTSLTKETFKLSSLKDSIEQLTKLMSKSLIVESKGILGALEKIMQAIKTIDQTGSTQKNSLEQLLDKKIPSEISKLNEAIKSVIQKADPLFSKEITQILNRLETLNTAGQLNPQNSVKELLSNDLKALLLQAGNEITKSSHPNQGELLRHIDKLSLQIDYHQLLSHLSNGSSLYLPFSWDMLQEGNIELKKADEEKFYCDIDLKLKEYGELNLKLVLYDKNQLNLHIYSSNEEFKNIVKENIPTLRSALIEAQVTPREIRIFEPNKKITTSYENQSDNLQMGFEVKA
jgi:hypothetical protein